MDQNQRKVMAFVLIILLSPLIILVLTKKVFWTLIALGLVFIFMSFLYYKVIRINWIINRTLKIEDIDERKKTWDDLYHKKIIQQGPYYNYISVDYYQLGDFEKAVFYNNKSQEAYGNKRGKKDQFMIYELNQCVFYLAMENYNELPYLIEQIELKIKNKNLYINNVLSIAKAKLAFHMGNLEEGMNYSGQIICSEENPSYRYEQMMLEAEYEWMTGHPADAWEKIEGVLNQNNFLPLQIKAENLKKRLFDTDVSEQRV